MKVRIAKVKPRKLIGKKAQVSLRNKNILNFWLTAFSPVEVFRAWKGSREEMRSLRNPKFSLTAEEKCCAEKAKVRPRAESLSESWRTISAAEEGEVPGDGEERLQAGRGPQADLHRALEQV